jgi:glycosyltransferase involved in cell wall biosynthesis
VVKLKEGGFIKKIVSTCWETIAFNNETIAKKKRIKEIVKKNIDLFICPTEKAKLSLTVEGITDDKIRIIRVGVDLDRFKNKISNIKYQKNKSNIKNKKRDSFNMLFVGRLIEEKGVMEVYEIFKNVKCQMSSCDKLRMTLSKVEVSNVKTRLKLRIVGDGYLKEKLLNMIKKDKLGDNVFIEKKSYEEMPRVYQEADVLVVPSKTTPTWEEQYGMVLVEAMASGLPIVAYPSGAIPEVLGKAGLLVKEGDVKGLTQAIITLMNNTDLRIKLGKIGRRRAEKEFDREKIAKKIENIYKRLVLPT